MIVGTAGHIDHGKTALVRALTGTDADRLPEEKRRGITIELGYAFMPVPESAADAPTSKQRISFVDVPGHEKLVRTMVAGASGIDYALLLIAADDGVMPQTREHLTILSLLQVRRGAAVITKIDRAEDGSSHEREAQARDLLAGAGLDDWPVLSVSAQRGDGLAELRTLLLEEARRAAPAVIAQAGFRMGLDRAFTLDGIGTVVAGSIAAGTLRVGDQLCLAHAPDKPYRVRSLHSHNQSVMSATAGQRCAVGLAGLERSEALRGQTLCDPAIAQQSWRLDVWLRVAPDEAAPLRSGTQVHLHAATQERMATVAVLGQASIAPGEAAPAQLVLQQALHAWHGDRFVLRDASASRTVAGGSVLDTDAPARYRQTAQRLAYLQSQRTEDFSLRLQAALAHAPFGVHGAQWLRQAGLVAWPFEQHLLEDAVFSTNGEWIISRQHLAQSETAVLDALKDFHTRLPQDVGPDLKRARRLAAPRMPEALWRQLIARLVEDGRIAVRGSFVHLSGHGEQLRAADKVVAERALPQLLQGHFEPPWVRDLAGDTHLPEEQVRQVLARLAKTGDVFQVVKDLYYHPHTVQQLASLARGIGQRESQHGGHITAANFRDATGLGRKRAIQILEFFDRIGFLRRVGDSHLLRPGTPLFPEQEYIP
jgi:selenocysteine-specific elongation factor